MSKQKTPNKWISVKDSYPLCDMEIEIMVQKKVVSGVFKDGPDYRSCTINKDEYIGFYKPSYWRLKKTTVGVVVKCDQTSGACEIL